MSTPRRARSSRSRFRAYLDDRKSRDHTAQIHESVDQKTQDRRLRARRRGVRGLLGSLWALLAGFRFTIGLALVTLSISVGLGLLMPLSTKVALDYIVTDNPGPTEIPGWVGDFGADRASRVRLIWILGGAMLAVTSSAIVHDYSTADVSLMGGAYEGTTAPSHVIEVDDFEFCSQPFD